jgi:hypothetical protein
MTQNKAASNQREFKFGNARAHAWLQILSRQPLPPLDIGADWNPRAGGEETTVSQLISLAMEQGVIAAPDGMSVSFDYGDNGEATYYRYLIDLTRDLTLATAAVDIQLLGGELSARGINAAVCILNEAAYVATETVSHLDAYIAR